MWLHVISRWNICFLDYKLQPVAFSLSPPNMCLLCVQFRSQCDLVDLVLKSCCLLLKLFRIFWTTAATLESNVISFHLRVSPYILILSAMFVCVLHLVHDHSQLYWDLKSDLLWCLCEVCLLSEKNSKQAWPLHTGPSFLLTANLFFVTSRLESQMVSTGRCLV